MTRLYVLFALILSNVITQEVTEDTKVEDDLELKESLLDEQEYQKQHPLDALEGDMKAMTLHRYIESKANEPIEPEKVKSPKKPGSLPTKRSIPFKIKLDRPMITADAIIEKTRCQLAIQEAIGEIKKKTCIDFKPHEDEANYISFAFNNAGALADIGVEPGEQKILITIRTCYKGTMLHEILHTLGMMHEHTRPDRDSYISINITNIKDGMMKNFEKYAHLIGDDLPYDYESIMHPPINWFSKDPQNLNTIKPNNIIYQDQKLGQRDGLSKLDAAKLNAAFQCPEKYLDKPELPEPEKPQLNSSLMEDQFSTPAPTSTSTTSTTTKDPFNVNQDDSVTNPSINNDEDDDDKPKSDDNPFPEPGSDNEPPIPFPMQESDNNNERRKKIGKHAVKLMRRRKHKN
ncbi:zinc metalloproteinase nas-14 isoform X4 [Hydra vulgaris]|uniref:Metalloendopeptidase n=1 Tax=Hydra vulgaris TaxID=6087 RepID=A0ABM4D753_HYDVU